METQPEAKGDAAADLSLSDGSFAPRPFGRYYLLDHHGLLEAFSIDRAKMLLWLVRVEERYKPSNPYHNSTHAADVTAYRDEMLALVRSGVELASGTKARAAALLWRAGERDAVAALLAERAVLGVAEMLAFVRLLDHPRRATQLEAKLARSSSQVAGCALGQWADRQPPDLLSRSL